MSDRYTALLSAGLIDDTDGASSETTQLPALCAVMVELLLSEHLAIKYDCVTL